MYAIIIPTMQRATTLGELVRRLDAHALVDEIVIINNGGPSLQDLPLKARAIDLARNIYVNPAWNLGVQQTTAPVLAIVNDDVLFDPRLLDFVGDRLNAKVGMVGASWSEHTKDAGPGAWSLRPTYERSFGYGSLMIMQRERYVTIPETLKINYGDDWLFSRQTRRNYKILGAANEVPTMSTTVSDESFEGTLVEDGAEFARLSWSNPYAKRFRHEAVTYSALRRAKSFARGRKRQNHPGPSA